MERHREEFSVVLLVRVLRVSRSAYYHWRKRAGQCSPRAQAQAVLDEQVRELFHAHKGRYGSPRITKELADMGYPHDDKTIASSLRRQDLVARAGRKFKATTNSNHSLPVAPNLLEQNFSAARPNQKWAQDITYLATDEGWLYLATVIDLYSRQVIGWAMDKHMRAGLVCDALTMAIFRRARPRSVIVHSDRGGQYCSHRFQRLLKRHDLVCSMSKRADCYDNACAESFFHTLKVELTHGQRYETREHLKRDVFEYIETYYNTVRRHSALGYVSPTVFEKSK